MSLIQNLRCRIGDTRRAAVDRYLHRRGYTAVRSGGSYIDAGATAAEAKRMNLSICEYLESKEDDPRKVGRRDRIIDKVLSVIDPQEVRCVVEIGSGTGMYLDRITEDCMVSDYEVYETDLGWQQFLKSHCSKFDCTVQVHQCDGRSLSKTATCTADFVHAHGVFVYLSTIQTAAYLVEMARVCKPSGFVVLDVYAGSTFDLQVTRNWLASGWTFPVVIDEEWLIGLAKHLGLDLVDRFEEIHGASWVTYFIFRRLQKTF